MQGTLTSNDRAMLVTIDPKIQAIGKGCEGSKISHTEIVETSLLMSSRLKAYLKRYLRGNYGFPRVDIELVETGIAITLFPKKR